MTMKTGYSGKQFKKLARNMILVKKERKEALKNRQINPGWRSVPTGVCITFQDGAKQALGPTCLADAGGMCLYWSVSSYFKYK